MTNTPKGKIAVPKKTAKKMVGFTEAIRLFFVRCFDFNGVSTRAEFWWGLLLFVGVVAGVFGLMYMLPGLPGPVSLVFGVLGLFCDALLIPFLALWSRRIHDAGFSAYVYFMVLIVSLVLSGDGLFGLIRVLQCAVIVFGFLLVLMPSKVHDNPYRE